MMFGMRAARAQGAGHFRTFALSHFRTFALSHFRTFALSHFRTFALSHFALSHLRVQFPARLSCQALHGGSGYFGRRTDFFYAAMARESFCAAKVFKRSFQKRPAACWR